jgi:hypothetical protein
MPESYAALKNTRTRERIDVLGKDLRQSLQAVLDAFPAGTGGPQALAEASGCNKVFTSRLGKALRQPFPQGVVFHLPGPEPITRFLASLAARDVDPALIAAARKSVAEFDRTIREEAGSRSALNAMVSAWLPDSQAEFELRRRQAVFRATSELKGASVAQDLATVVLHPSADGKHVDVLWIMGLLGLRRLRPGAPVKLATRRLSGGEETVRSPQSLSKELGLEDYCILPPAPVHPRRSGKTVHYLLGESGYGARSSVDLLIAELNLNEMLRLPVGADRLGFVFAECSTPAEHLAFDILVHDALFAAGPPELRIYDTTFDGVADPNDDARGIDLLETSDRIEPAGRGFSKLGVDAMPRYRDMLDYVITHAGWNSQEFAAWTIRADYPLYGSQYAVCFQPQGGRSD